MQRSGGCGPPREHHARAVDAADVHDGAFELALQRALVVHLLIEVALAHGGMIEQAEILGAAGESRTGLENRARMSKFVRRHRDGVGAEREIDIVAAQPQSQRGAIRGAEIGDQHDRSARIHHIENPAQNRREDQGPGDQIEELALLVAKTI